MFLMHAHVKLYWIMALKIDEFDQIYVEELSNGFFLAKFVLIWSEFFILTVNILVCLLAELWDCEVKDWEVIHTNVKHLKLTTSTLERQADKIKF